jgi:hypothetical protein
MIMQHSNYPTRMGGMTRKQRAEDDTEFGIIVAAREQGLTAFYESFLAVAYVQLADSNWIGIDCSLNGPDWEAVVYPHDESDDQPAGPDTERQLDILADVPEGTPAADALANFIRQYEQRSKS